MRRDHYVVPANGKKAHQSEIRKFPTHGAICVRVRNRLQYFPVKCSRYVVNAAQNVAGIHTGAEFVPTELGIEAMGTGSAQVRLVEQG